MTSENYENENIWYNKGDSLFLLEKYEEAIQCYNKEIKINPQNEIKWNNKGFSLYNLGKYEETIECHNKALNINISKLECMEQ